jgi:hypothetical protein
MKYEVEFAKFITVEIEADSKSEAEDKAAVMETEEIEAGSVHFNDGGYEIWDVKEKG